MRTIIHKVLILITTILLLAPMASGMGRRARTDNAEREPARKEQPAEEADTFSVPESAQPQPPQPEQQTPPPPAQMPPPTRRLPKAAPSIQSIPEQTEPKAAPKIIQIPLRGLDSLQSVEDNFTFVVISDPHTASPGHVDASESLPRIVDEINAMQPQPAFAVFNADLLKGSTAGRPQIGSDLLRRLDTLPVTIQSSDETLYRSFDCGQWHFVSLPASQTIPDAQQQQTLDWLANDLMRNNNRPTIILIPYHLLPVGLTQFEYDSYPMPFRRQLVDLIADSGNVRYVLSGQVPVGMQSAQKTAWIYAGTTFFICPALVRPHPYFSEEYPAYKNGLQQGGYFLNIDANGPRIQLIGKRIGSAQEWFFRPDFSNWTPQTDPRALYTLPELPSTQKLENPGFEDGFENWLMPHRYSAEDQAAYEWETVTHPVRSGWQSARLLCQAPNLAPATDELIEQYQIITVPENSKPQFRASYLIEQPSECGGGYIRLHFYRQQEFQFMMFFYWGNGWHTTQNLPRLLPFLDFGRPVSLHRLAAESKAMFWPVTQQYEYWHDLEIHVADLYDETHEGQTFASLGIDKMLVACGVWVGSEPGSVSEAYFDDFELDLNIWGQGYSHVEQVPLDTTKAIFRCPMGKE